MERVRVAAIGMASWDRLIVTDFYPDAGNYAIVRRTLEQSGGTTANMVHALAKLGVPVTFAAKVGDDDEGRELRRVLEAEGCDCTHLTMRPGEPSDSAIIVVSGTGNEVDRTIYWHQGARLTHGDSLPLADLFAHDLVILDVDDPRLRRFVVDLPTHTSPWTRFLGTLTYLVEMPPEDGLETALRHDYLAGNQRELRYLTGCDDIHSAIRVVQERMIYTDLRLFAISMGPDGCILAGQDSLVHVPAFDVEVVDTTGAGDAFGAGVALGILERREMADIGRLANAMGALSIRDLGARSSLPTRSELDHFLSHACLRTDS